VSFELWTWSRGEPGQLLDDLVESWNGAQDDSRARVRRWPELRGGREPGREMAAALAGLGRRGAREVALLEVPDTALPALLAAGRAHDLSGRFSEPWGVRWDDFQGWLVPAALYASDGIVAVPLFVESPLLALGPTVRARTAADALAELAAGAAEAEDLLPLAAAADHRLFLCLAELAGPALARGTDAAPGGLDRQAAAAALERLAALTRGRPFRAGSEGEAAAIAAFGRGRSRAAWLWSSRAALLDRSGARLLRAPARPRGTYLVVHAQAHWRARQAAFRLALWLSEPLQTVEIAARLGTVPVRRSAAAGPLQTALARRSPWRAEAARASRPLTLPADGLVESLVEVLEPALEQGEAGPAVLSRLKQRPLAADGQDGGVAVGRDQGRGARL